MSDYDADVVVWAHREHPLQDLCERAVRAKTHKTNYRFHRSIAPTDCHQGMSRALKTGSARYVCLLDEDVEVLTDDWLAHLIRALEQDESLACVNAVEYKDEFRRHGYLQVMDGKYCG
ncbi:MAG TPA: glycosyltransferase, partial [Reyranellaceae bacterium]|nr:glycosyltransferase [Reyranellaceae bacterium]